jgi:TetR/AcrR family transcriptional regulator, transcriptional repressor for nem operon
MTVSEVTDAMAEDRGSRAQERPAKRDRLVDAAAQMFYEQGVERTTIADIATAADVPLGNVYYYFKTKDDIVDAVVSARIAEIEATYAALATRYDTPADRLKALFRSLSEQAEIIAQRGCPIGSLCTELSKRVTGPEANSAKLMQALIDGAEQQFQEMGRSDAHELAIEMITAYQGTAVLAHATTSPDLMRRESDRVDRWIDEVQPAPKRRARVRTKSPLESR